MILFRIYIYLSIYLQNIYIQFLIIRRDIYTNLYIPIIYILYDLSLFEYKF